MPRRITAAHEDGRNGWSFLAISGGTCAVVPTDALIVLFSGAKGGASGNAPIYMLLAGLLDSAANALYVTAAQRGRLDVAAVLSSLYPASTVILARLVLNERLSRLQAAGMVAALVAVALISW